MLVLGHRGTITDSVSQNSKQAFQQAIDCADGFECDMCRSADNEVFIIHEELSNGVYSLTKHLDATSKALVGSRRIDQLNSDDITKLRLKDGQPLPTLRETLRQVGAMNGKVINIELKAHNVAPLVLDIIRDSIKSNIIKPEAMVLSSFNHAALAYVRKEMPFLKIGALFVTDDEAGQILYPWLNDVDGTYMGLTTDTLKSSLIREINPDWCIMPEEMLRPNLLKIVTPIFPNAALAAWVYTERGNFNLPDLLARLKTFPKEKIAAMIVDHPAVFVHALSQSTS